MGTGEHQVEEVSYEQFDSKEFEADQPEDNEETTQQEAATEAEGEDKTPTEEAAGSEGEAADDKAGEEEKPYEPNLKYKVYDEEKEFPEQLKSLVKDKDTEDYFRTLLSKADGLDGMKVRHQETISERDELKSQVDWYRNDVNRVLDLRDKAPHLFVNELGISDDWIIKRAKEIVEARETPEAWNSFNRNRDLMVQNYNQQLQLNTHQQQQTYNLQAQTQQGMQMAMSHPEIASFRQQFDQVHGLGAFEKEVMKHGYYHYEETAKTGRPVNLPPSEAVKQVYEFHKKAFSALQPQAPQKTAEQQTTQRVARPKVDPVPNLGKGRNASPTSGRFKSIQALRDYVEKNVP